MGVRTGFSKTSMPCWTPVGLRQALLWMPLPYRQLGHVPCQSGERAGGRRKASASSVLGSSWSLWPGGDRRGTGPGKERLWTSDSLLSEAEMCSREELSQKKCWFWVRSYSFHVVTGKVLSTFQRSSKYQQWWDDANCIRRGYYSPGEYVWPLLLIYILQLWMFRVCLPRSVFPSVSASELQLPASWKLGAERKIIMGSDGNESAPRWLSAFYMAWSSLQEQGEGELLAGPMLWVKYILACREKPEDTHLCLRKVDYKRW